MFIRRFEDILNRKIIVFGIVVSFFILAIVPNINCKINLTNKNTLSELTSFNPFKEGWKYRKKVTINHNNVAGNLNDFPVLISITDSDLRDKAQIDGDDILFMDGKGVAKQLYHEIERFDDSSGELISWVNIPSLSPFINTIFYMYYGNLQCASQEYPEKVWDSDYIHVWHLGDDLIDSAGSDDGTNYGTDIISGKIGNARDFEQSESDYIDLGDMTQPADDTLTTMTWEAWVKPKSLDIHIMSKYNSQGPDYQSYLLSIHSDGAFKSIANSDFYTDTSAETDYSIASENEWIYLTCTFNLGGINEIKIFSNGVEVPCTRITQDADFMCNTPVSDDIGRLRVEAGTYYTDAVIDEVKWSKVIRSNNWISASYNTMNKPSSFLSFGPEIPNQKAYFNISSLKLLEKCPILYQLLQRFLEI